MGMKRENKIVVNSILLDETVSNNLQFDENSTKNGSDKKVRDPPSEIMGES